ncbi:GGDEF domain-containing protein [Brucellaceae bacterium C25G]
MKFALPSILFLVTFFLSVAWIYSRERKYLLVCSAGFFLICLASIIQIIPIITIEGGSSVLSAIGYILGSQFITAGVLYRSGKTVNFYIYGFLLISIICGIIYFFYFDHNLFARIYLVNFGMAAFFLIAVFRLRKLVWGSSADRILLFCLLLIGIHFFPKVWMTYSAVHQFMPGHEYLGSSYWDATSFWSAILGLILGLIIVLSVIMEVIAMLMHDRDTDALTGLINRRGLLNRMKLIGEERRNRTDCIIMCDLDYFKNINDTYGHGVGDKVLKQLASILVSSIGERDLAVRLGGEEFVLILHQKSVEQAYIMIERLRNEIEDTFFDGLDETHILTCSFGISKLHHQEDIWTVIERADKHLYRAKNDGRNRVYTEDTKVSLRYS